MAAASKQKAKTCPPVELINITGMFVPKPGLKTRAALDAILSAENPEFDVR